MWFLITAALLTLVPAHGWLHVVQLGLVGALALGAAALIMDSDD